MSRIACYSRSKKETKGCGSCVQRAQDFIQPSVLQRPGLEDIVHTYKPSTKEAEVGESQVQGHPQLRNKLKVNKGGYRKTKITHKMTVNQNCSHCGVEDIKTARNKP